ncbi:MAG: hypothetical protein KGL74_05800 [Elusimicrobia bacterium]|nr:hypothetical protein [Elusimicrobiota bacterium]
MKMKKIVAVAVMTLGLAAATQPAFAAVNRASLRNSIRERLLATISRFTRFTGKVSSPPKIKSFTGTLTITKADKTVVTIKSGDPIPQLGAGDTINVVSGTADLTIGGNDVTAGTGSNLNVTGNGVTLESGSATFGGQPLAQGGTVTDSTTPPSTQIVTGGNTPPPPPPSQQKAVVSPSTP